MSRRVGAALLCAAVWALLPRAALAWGDEGHEIVALIAIHDLKAPARRQVEALLDGTTLAEESNWADRYRDSDRATSRIHYEQTRRWHYIDLELHGADLAAACAGRPPLPAGTRASNGPAEDCVVDKIEQFEAELAAKDTPLEERRLALKFLVHLVGDLHQPLHAIDDEDQGGNLKHVVAPGLAPGSLHFYWDVEFVRALGPAPGPVAAGLIARITPAERRRWQRGSVEDWARDSYAVGASAVYAALPPPEPDGQYRLPAGYVAAADAAVARQLSAAGVRLALLLNRSLLQKTAATGDAAQPAGPNQRWEPRRGLSSVESEDGPAGARR